MTKETPVPPFRGILAKNKPVGLMSSHTRMLRSHSFRAKGFLEKFIHANRGAASQTSRKAGEKLAQNSLGVYRQLRERYARPVSHIHKPQGPNPVLWKPVDMVLPVSNPVSPAPQSAEPAQALPFAPGISSPRSPAAQPAFNVGQVIPRKEDDPDYAPNRAQRAAEPPARKPALTPGQRLFSRVEEVAPGKPAASEMGKNPTSPTRPQAKPEQEDQPAQKQNAPAGHSSEPANTIQRIPEPPTREIPARPVARPLANPAAQPPAQPAKEEKPREMAKPSMAKPALEQTEPARPATHPLPQSPAPKDKNREPSQPVSRIPEQPRPEASRPKQPPAPQPDAGPSKTVAAASPKPPTAQKAPVVRRELDGSPAKPIHMAARPAAQPKPAQPAPRPAVQPISARPASPKPSGDFPRPVTPDMAFPRPGQPQPPALTPPAAQPLDHVQEWMRPVEPEQPAAEPLETGTKPQPGPVAPKPLANTHAAAVQTGAPTHPSGESRRLLPSQRPAARPRLAKKPITGAIAHIPARPVIKTLVRRQMSKGPEARNEQTSAPVARPAAVTSGKSIAEAPVSTSQPVPAGLQPTVHASETLLAKPVVRQSPAAPHAQLRPVEQHPSASNAPLRKPANRAVQHPQQIARPARVAGLLPMPVRQPPSPTANPGQGPSPQESFQPPAQAMPAPDTWKTRPAVFRQAVEPGLTASSPITEAARSEQAPSSSFPHLKMPVIQPTHPQTEPAVVQRELDTPDIQLDEQVSTVSPKEAPSQKPVEAEIDLDQVARQVYPVILKKLQIERERSSGRMR